MDTGQLPRWLGFTDQDLSANREATLSSRQRRRLLWSGVWRLIVGPPLSVLPVVLALQMDSAVVIVVALLFTAYGLYLSWRGFAFFVDAVDGSVAFLTGSMDRREVHNKNSTTYYATIPPISKRVSSTVYRSLPVGLQCHLYYAPGCRSLLSVEPASETEPKPAHPFGPDSAHAWDRLRASWVALTIGVFAVLIGLHAVVTAHPARALALEAGISNYVETHGKSTRRTFYLTNGSSYTPQDEGSYSPPAPAFSTFIGRQVTLYVNAGTTDVLGIYDGEQTYGSDWYWHPEHQTTNEIVNGVAVIALGAVLIVVAVAVMVHHRRRTLAANVVGMGPEGTYSPPSVRRALELWPAVTLFLAGLSMVFLVFALTVHR